MPLVHATAVQVEGTGVLLRGPSGSGKSDLALRLIDAGAILVADDQCALERAPAGIEVRAPAPLAGKLEVRGLGIITLPAATSAILGLVVDLVAPPAVSRLPDPQTAEILGVSLPCVRLAAFEASAAAKLRLAVVSCRVFIIPAP